MSLQRQGDVLVVPVDSIPEDAKELKGETVLVEGEITGHAHRIRSSDLAAKKAVLMMVGMQMYMKVLEHVHIDHEDHGTNVFPPGNYEIRRQAEYTPDGWQKVLD